MTTVCTLNQCTGCMACVELCPQNAIEIQDSLDAYNAVIDQNKCVNCNLCHKICQVNHALEPVRPIVWKQGWASDPAIRAASSSGGLAATMEMEFVRQGGIVCSCTFRDGVFGFSLADSLAQVGQFTGSKYVKSNPKGCYQKIKQILLGGKKVLFVGLPCQVAGVKTAVGNQQINLYTVDLICHGSPSPQILERYLDQYDLHLDSLSSLEFRQKSIYRLKSGAKTLEKPKRRDHYSMAFLSGICNTENCYSCRYARLERISDLTLGDSWGSDLPDQEQKRGISLILCQTEKGKELLNLTQADLQNVDLSKAMEANHQLKSPAKCPKRRAYFFDEIKKGKAFNSVVIKCYPWDSLKQFVKGLLL